MRWADRENTLTDRRMGYSVLCLCDAVLLVDPGSIGIGMATTMRSWKERASIGFLMLYARGGLFFPLKRMEGLPPPGARSAALPWVLSGAALPGRVPHKSGLDLRTLRYWGGIDI